VLLFAGEDLLNLHGTGDHHYVVLRLNSVIFNSFVMMQVFSEINARKMSELNVFENIHKSPVFVSIIVLTVATQVAFIEGVGRSVVGPAIGFMNLTGAEWSVSIVIGAGALPVGLAARLMPLRWFPGKTDEQADKEAQDSARAAQDAAATAAEEALSDGDVRVSITEARRRWKKAKTFVNAYTALTAPMTVQLAMSRKGSRGSRLMVDEGDGETDDFGLGISSGIKPKSL
jgi:Ca2+-transporting ATPase